MPTREVVRTDAFNSDAQLPFELRLKDFEIAMQDVYDFFYDVNVLFQKKGLPRRTTACGRRSCQGCCRTC